MWHDWIQFNSIRVNAKHWHWKCAIFIIPSVWNFKPSALSFNHSHSLHSLLSLAAAPILCRPYLSLRHERTHVSSFSFAFSALDMIIHYDFAEDNFDEKNMRTFASHQWISEWVFLPKYSLPRNGSLLQCFAKHTISMWKATYWFFCCSSFRFRLNIDYHLIECTYMCNQYGFWCIICHMPYEFRMSVCHRYLAAVDWFLRNTECKPNFNCNVSHKK